MEKPRATHPVEPNLTAPRLQPSLSSLRGFGVAFLAVTAGFIVPLIFVVRFSRADELYSYIPLIPFVSGYLFWADRHSLPDSGPRLSSLWPVTFFVAAAAFLALALTNGGPLARPSPGMLCLFMLAYVSSVAACAAFFLPAATVRALRFPLAFLLFLAPMPAALEAAIESGLQHSSAWAAHQLFNLTGTPALRNSTYFQLPAFSMQVAPECSGIRSTLALFLTSIVAGHVLLRRPWTKIALAVAVIPIAIARNGFRVYVIGELCVRVGPHMIDSWIHRHGGPLFFALSLIPFGALALLLVRADNRRPQTAHE